MKAIVLAAGKGTRLGALTREMPKPMLSVNGRPILEHVIAWLKTNGIFQIGINLFSMPDKIICHFGDGTGLGVEIQYVTESELSGTAGAIPKFKGWLGTDDSFLVVYSDIITDQYLKPLIELHHCSHAFATLLVHRRSSSNSFIEMDASGRIIRFLERPGEREMEMLKHASPEGFIVNSAVQILSRRSLEYIEANNSFDLPKDVYMPNVDREKIYGLELTGERVAVDSPARLELARKIFR